MLNHITLSILIPIYGVEKYIGRCARSLFERLPDGTEIVFVNDCTKDKSVDILTQVLNEYPSIKDRIRIINHEKNLGLADARLTGLNAAQGEYVWFMDSDDYLAENAVNKVRKELVGDIDLLTFNYIFDRNGEKEKHKRKIPYISGLLTTNVAPMVWCNIIKKSILTDNSILPIQGYDHGEDFLLMTRLITKIKKIKHIDEYLYYYNLENNNSYMNNISLKSCNSLVNGLKVIIEFYKQNNLLQEYKHELCHRALTYMNTVSGVGGSEEIKQSLISMIKELDKAAYYIWQMTSLINNKYKARFIKGVYYNLFVKKRINA